MMLGKLLFSQLQSVIGPADLVTDTRAEQGSSVEQSEKACV